MRRLGLDMGTNSIGWCLIEDDTRIVDIGVRIFSDGRDPKSGASLAVDRRDARSMRRRRDRYLGRRSAFLETLVQYGLMASDADEAKLIAAKDPYDLRARALDARLEPFEIGRALFHLNQRRGFKSNRKAERKANDNEDGKIASGANALKEAMEAANARTLGEFLHKRLMAGEGARVRMNSESQSYDFYPQRDHVEREFESIWQAQTKHHPALLTQEAHGALHRILFFQRPLKAQEVGVCTFVNDERRLAKAHPLFQERRLYEEVNQLEITTPGEPARKLSLDERDLLIRILREKRKVSYSTLATKLKLRPGQSFNKASETRTDMLGNEVFAVMADKKRFGTRWNHFDIERQWKIIDRVMEEEDPETLHTFLTDECGLDDDAADFTARANLPEGYGRLGTSATAKILEELKREIVTYSRAVELCGWHHSDHRTGEILPQLPYYGELLTREIPPGTLNAADDEEKRWGKITNPTVHIGLRQVQKLVNAIIKVHSRPDTIVVELARELKLNDKAKEEHNKRIRKDTAAAIARGEKLQKEGFADNGANRMLMRLWEDLNPSNVLDRRCPYCGEAIGMRALFTSEADIDHIIPYSRCLDDSAGNKVVVHRKCNREKGNRTPYEKWGHDSARWDTISAQVARMHKSKQWRFGPDAMERVEKDGGFIARQLTDTQYLSRMTKTYLQSLYADTSEGSVYVIPGRMTAMLRRLWGLNDITDDHNYVENKHSDAPKNRLNHFHHAIDAAVIAVTTRSTLMKIARTASQAEDMDLDRLFPDLEPPWPEFRNDLRERLKTTIISHKADHGRKAKPLPGKDVTAGRLHNDTAYGFVRDPASEDGIMCTDKGLPIVVHRVPLMSLKPGDFTDPLRIPDETLRDALYRATEDLAGKDYEAALARFANEGSDKLDRHGRPMFKGLRRVRVREPLSVIPIRDKAGRAYKAYKGDSNARFDVWRMPDGKWVSDIVSMFDAHQPDAATRRPHPAAKKVLSLRQNDMLAIEREGEAKEIVRVVKFSTIGSIQLAGTTEGGALKARDASPSDVDPFKYINSSASGLKKLKGRQVRVDPLGRVFDPGPRD
ncbi:type II CRISPR RNA-guided endonuclease Cas9 [Blastomonas sp.]|uniref:type II CRISPR RNA-guided endonuclease Cas9 n=1 Tax=Blastomonas sp. TaxID=1909299 RepID=UPI0035938C41